MAPSPTRSYSPQRAIAWIASLLLVIATVILAGRLVERSQVDVLEEQGKRRAERYAEMLNSELSRYNYLPAILPLNATIVDLLRKPDDPALVAAADRYLQTIDSEAGSAALYVADRRGHVLAASNWDESISFVGIDVSYRPYFRDAMQSGTGEFYGVGTSSGEAGYYFARAIEVDGERLGVAVVKVALSGIEKPFGWGSDPAIVADEYGVVILTSVPEWRYRMLDEIPPDVLRQIRTTRKYANVELHGLNLRVDRSIADNVKVVSLPNDSALSLPEGDAPPRIKLLAQEAPISRSGWKIIVLSRLTDVELLTRAAQLVTALALGSLLLLALYVSARRRAMRIRLAAKEALERANLELERKVFERTEDLVRINARLRDEVAERQRAETVLRETQDELVHAGKLAVIGQMAAGMTHELNQPVAALRTLADNTALLLERNRPEAVRSNLDMIGRTVERMAKITSQLKAFARKSEGRPQPAAVGLCLDHALALVEGRLTKQQVEVVRIPEQTGALVLCDPGRLEQVLVNLLTNALDALSECTDGRIEIVVSRHEGEAGDGRKVRIAICDNGPGIPDAVLPRLFEPFFTTKPAGVGLGLGMTISEGIVRQFGGSLRACNRPGSGAELTIELPETRCGDDAS